MKLLKLCALMMAGGWASAVGAELQLQPDNEPQSVFAGVGRSIHLVWQNTGDKIVTMDIHAQTLQTSAATAMLISQTNWKELQVLPGQTVVESAQLNFPVVRVRTKFLIEWFENTNIVLGHTEVMAYPTNLLAELKSLVLDKPVGVLDPQNLLKPLLKELGVIFTDLQACKLEDFPGQLAIIGPFNSKSQMRDGLTDQVRKLARRGAGIVWYQPPAEKSERLVPSFYPVFFKTNAVVIVQADLAGDLTTNPLAQLHLLSFCRLALKPAPFRLPQPILRPLTN
jgi:hypothetical protein